MKGDQTSPTPFVEKLHLEEKERSERKQYESWQSGYKAGLKNGGKKVCFVAIVSLFTLIILSFIALFFGAPNDIIWQVSAVIYICIVSFSVPS